jgi:hypothetical protein
VLGPSDEQAGMLVVTDPVHTDLADNPGLSSDFLMHTEAGTYAGTLDGPVSWDFRWVAPDFPIATFYFAGVAANYDFNLTGDYVYATSVAVLRQDPVGIEPNSWSRIKSLYRSR